MSEKSEVTAALVIGLGNTLGRAVEDAATRLSSLGSRLDPTLHLRNLIDDVRTVQYTLDVQYRANERNAGESRLALRRVIDLLALRPVTVGHRVAVMNTAPATSAPTNDWRRLEEATKAVLSIGSLGDVIKASLGTSFGFRARVMQLRESAGLPYDKDAEGRLGEQFIGIGNDSAMPRDKVLDLAQAMREQKIPLDDVMNLLPGAAQFAQGQGVSLETTARLVQALQQKGGIGSAQDLQKALGAVAWHGQKDAPSVELFTRELLSKLDGVKAGDRQGVDALLNPRRADGSVAEVPGDVLQQGVQQRRDSPLGQLEALEQQVSGALLGIGDVLLDSKKMLVATVAALGLGLPAAKALMGAKQLLDGLRGKSGAGGVQDVFVTNWPDWAGGDISGSGSRGKRRTGGKRGKGNTGGSGRAGRGGIVQRAKSGLGRAVGAARGWLGGAARQIGSSRVGRVAGGLLRGAGAGLRRIAPLGAAMSALDIASVYNSDLSPQEKAVGYGKASGSAIGAAAGAALGTFIPIPVVGTLVGGAIGAAVGEWLGGKAGEQLGKPSEPPREGASTPVVPAAVPASPTTATVSGPANWTFSPQVNISVAGNIVNPQQLIDELLPVMRRLIQDAQQDRQRNALFDTVVV